MKNKFSVTIGSPVDFEQLVAYIETNYKEKKKKIDKDSGKSVTFCTSDDIAMLHQEEGKDKIKIKFSKDVLKEEFYLDEFIDILQKAKQELEK